MVGAGHEVGLHGRFHLWPILMPTSMLVAELNHAAAAIEGAGGPRPDLYRAPFGLLRPGQHPTNLSKRSEYGASGVRSNEWLAVTPHPQTR